MEASDITPKCSKCSVPVDGLLWVGPYYYCWEHFHNATAVERIRVGSLVLEPVEPLTSYDRRNQDAT